VNSAQHGDVLAAALLDAAPERIERRLRRPA
jgi:hypothetical protein